MQQVGGSVKSLFNDSFKEKFKKAGIVSFYYPPWNNDLEPNQGDVRQFLDNLYSKFQPIEQARA